MSHSNPHCRGIKLAITPGEPAGIGPELLVQLAQQHWPPPDQALPTIELVAVADPELLLQRAQALGLPLDLRPHDPDRPALPAPPGVLSVEPVHLHRPAVPGQLDPGNARYVLATLARASDGCLRGEFAALVTGPVHKGVINDAGIPFSGHTEWLAARLGGEPIMLLVAEPPGQPPLRVALATTHLPLAQVPDAIRIEPLKRLIRGLAHGLQHSFDLAAPRITVLGLNPHAGEGGHLGREEIEIISPVLTALRAEGLHLEGPLPADTAFTPKALARCDAVLAMYHDQGLPVLKHAGFGRAVNVTLGLPIVRTSVDHGTALDLAGRGVADPGSLAAAVHLATRMVKP